MKKETSYLWCDMNLIFSTFLLFILSSSFVNAENFRLVDCVCVEVEGQQVILLSEIKRRAQQKNLSFKDAQEDLIRERLVRIYVKKHLNYNLSAVEAAADDHIKRLMSEHKLVLEGLARVLMNTYGTTINSFRYETSSAILLKQFRDNLRTQVSLSDAQIKERMEKLYIKRELSSSLVIITISKDPKAKQKSTDVNSQLKKANEIHQMILTKKSLDDIKSLYGKDKSVSILPYHKDAFKKSYEERITRMNQGLITDPFLDDGKVTIIWRIKTADETALPKVRKELYEEAVSEKYKAVTDALWNPSTVIIKGCDTLNL